MDIHRKVLVLSLLSLVLIIPVSGAARSIWLEPPTGSEIRLEGVKPNFKNMEFSNLSMVWFLSGNFKTGGNGQISWDIPYANFSEKEGTASSSTIGNPYVGMEIGSENSPFRCEIGIRLPLASDEEDAAFLGAYADIVDRMEAFLPDVLSVIAGTNFRHQSANGLGLRLRLAPILWMDTGDTLADDSEIWIRYSGQAMVIMESGSVGVGFSGRYIATEERDDDFGEKNLNEFGIFANWSLGRWKPSARVRIPLDEDMQDLHNTGFIVSIGYELH